jgi:hypothetical protein
MILEEINVLSIAYIKRVGFISWNLCSQSNNVFLAILKTRHVALKLKPSVRALNTPTIKLIGFFNPAKKLPLVSENELLQIAQI